LIVIEKTEEIFPNHIKRYYIIKLNQFDDVAKNTLDEWIYFLKNEEVHEGFTAQRTGRSKRKT
jgi:hypothetical protein